MESVSLTHVSVESGDWEGIYINGKLEVEGHSIAVSDFLSIISEYKSFGFVTSIEVSDENMEKLGYILPSTIDELSKVCKK